MSETYSYKTKNELCRIPAETGCCAMAECYGMLLFGNTFNRREIKIITENKELGHRIVALFLKAFKTSFDIMPDEEDSGKQAYIINEQDKLNRIFDSYGFSKDKMLAHYVNLGILEEDCCRTAFIRGAFLTGGTVTDPVKSYHLEIVTAHYNVSRQTYSLLLEMGFTPKEASRTGHYIIYFKQSAVIEDFLTLIGAPLHAMQLMSTKIEKGMRNTVNRVVNCDTANAMKTIDAASAQIAAIETIKATGIYGTLAEKLRQTAEHRINNPDMSIQELADNAIPPVTKSCMNHRIRKLMQIASNITITENKPGS